MDFTFIHTSDIHLDSPLLGLEEYEGAPVSYVRGATRRAFENLVDLALREKVDLVLIAGDLYDGDWRDYNTGLFFISQMARLNRAGIQVCLVRGNHDASSQITHRLRLPPNCTDFSTSQPETVLFDDLKVAVHGQGFPHAAVREDISRGYPGARKGYFNIGLLHTCVNGRAGHDNYAPCDLSYLRSKGYDYWALGHVHRGEVLNRDPWIVFPGNLQGRHIREDGPKGCVLVTVKDGLVSTVQEHFVDVLRWQICPVDVSTSRSYDGVLDLAGAAMDRALAQSEGRRLALRMVLTGRCAVHERLMGNISHLSGNLRALAVDRGQESLWVEKVKVATRASVREESVLENHPVAALFQYLEESGGDVSFLEELALELERDRNALPSELFALGEWDPGCVSSLEEALPQVRELILSRLLDKEGLDREN